MRTGYLALASVLCSAAMAAPSADGYGSRSPASPTSVTARGVFGKRYCELLVVRKAGRSFAADVYNTYGLNACPARAWRAIDTSAVAKQLHALAAVRNGPRFWLMDAIIKRRQGREVIRDLGGLRMIEEATLPLASLNPAAYVIHRVNRTTTFIYSAGSRIYELHSPGGSTWVMQSWSRQVDPGLGLSELPRLGRRLHLPRGWRYGSRRLKRALRIVTVRAAAQVLQDDLRDSYSRVT